MRRGWLVLSLVAPMFGCGDNLGTNAAPTAIGFTLMTQEDLAVTRAVDAQDADGDMLVAQPSQPRNGTATANGLSITYTPNPDFHGGDHFEVKVTDGTDSVTVPVDVTVTSVNDPPFGGPDLLTTPEDTPRIVPIRTLLANDSDNDGDPLSLTAVGSATNGTVVIDANVVIFTPDPNFNGDASFVYELTDGQETASVDVAVSVGAVNDPPVAVDDTATTDEDTDLVLSTATLTANDTDVEGATLTIDSVANPVNGTVSLDTGTGDVTFSPDANFNGTATFEYTVSDGIDTDTATVTITVNPVNDPPVAGADSITQTGAANAIPHTTLLANDSDGGDGGPLAITAVGNAVNGTVTLEATTVTFTPDEGFSGTNASFEYTLSDGIDTDTGTVTVDVTSARVCGDGTPELPEECDDNNTDNTDGCTTGCKLARVCNATEIPGGTSYDVLTLNNHCYVTFDGTTTTFADAETTCEANGGYLTTITDSDESQFVTALMTSGQTPWIGGTDDANTTDAVFDWVTGEAFTSFTNFDTANGEPDDDVGVGGGGDCLHIADDTGLWGDTNCNITTFVVGQICEFEPDSCGDNVLEAGEDCDDGNTIDGDGCSSTCKIETLFSEYIEGSSNNKALEIRNPSTTHSADISGCTLNLFSNGNAIAEHRL